MKKTTIGLLMATAMFAAPACINNYLPSGMLGYAHCESQDLNTSSFEGIETINKATALYLSGNNIDNLDFLKNLKFIQYDLFLHNNKIKSLEPLKNFSRVSYLTIYNNPIDDLSPLDKVYVSKKFEFDDKNYSVKLDYFSFICQGIRDKRIEINHDEKLICDEIKVKVNKDYPDLKKDNNSSK